MVRKRLKIFITAAEVAPFSSVGGLSQVMYFLPRSLIKLGHDVRVFTPKYGTILEEKYKLKKIIDGMKVPTDGGNGQKHLVCNVKEYMGGARDPKVYFLENMEYYEKRSNVYGYSDDHIRFALLSRGTIEFLKHINWTPDVITTNDWHTAYLINDLRTRYEQESRLRRIAALL